MKNNHVCRHASRWTIHCRLLALPGKSAVEISTQLDSLQGDKPQRVFQIDLPRVLHDMQLEEYVYIVDDDAEIREGLQELLTHAGYRAQAFASGTEFLADCGREQRACLIVDYKMPDMSGLELQRHLHEQQWSLPCIFLSGNGKISVAVEALAQGAMTYLEKPCDACELLAAVSKAIAQAKQLTAQSVSNAAFQSLLRSLTVGELAVLHWILRGHSNRQIASQLDISLRTVQSRLASLLKKSGVRVRGELLDLAWSANRPALEWDTNPAA